jgi:hypothetical protein
MGAGELISQIRAEVHRAECIVFLGFAFHNQNLQLLRPSEPLSPRPIFATASGMSDSDVEVVSHSLGLFLKAGKPGAIRLENKLECAGLFDYYAKSLSGGD